MQQFETLFIITMALLMMKLLRSPAAMPPPPPPAPCWSLGLLLGACACCVCCHGHKMPVAGQSCQTCFICGGSIIAAMSMSTATTTTTATVMATAMAAAQFAHFTALFAVLVFAVAFFLFAFAGILLLKMFRWMLDLRNLLT